MVTHIGPNGPGDCGASSGKCPFGPGAHYDTADEARAVWEAMMEKTNPQLVLKKRIPATIEELKEKRSAAYKDLDSKMEEKFGKFWSTRMNEAGVYRGYIRYADEAESYDRMLSGMKFAPKDKPQTIETMTQERNVITSWLDKEAGARWDDWEEMVEEPEFEEEWSALYDRRTELDNYLKEQ